MKKEDLLKSGAFLIKETDYKDVFIPEELDEEQQMIAQTCKDFLETEIFPNLERIDQQEEGLMRECLNKAGDLGLLGISIPEAYEGFGQSFVTSMLASQEMGAGYSFSVAYSAHTGIGSMPIVYYGNDEQKQRYLPLLASGEWASAYCLTEPMAGSDANAGKSNAVLSEDGKHYILNGQKMWITNGGFADVFIVFAKIDKDRVHSAFIVESAWDGVVINPEEKKMGIKGSSTVQIFFNDVKVPVENLLGRRGEGFRIALNILHMGRIKLGAAVLGATKRAITQSVNYANERKQFGQTIGSFGAIKYKLAEQVIRHFVTESAVYRVSKNIDEMIAVLREEGMQKERASIEGIAAYQIEAACMKVFGSESLDFIVDEYVQILGGMGFSAETDADKAYRDSRINRIFEGTNEINRLLVTDTTIKKALKTGFDVVRYANHIIHEFDADNYTVKTSGDYFEIKQNHIGHFKTIALLLMGALSEKLERKFLTEQEIMMNISDVIMMVYGAESTMLRVQKLNDLRGETSNAIYRDILDVYVYDCACKINKAARDAINSFIEEGEKEVMMERVNTLTNLPGVNIKEARRRIANQLIEENRYCF